MIHLSGESGILKDLVGSKPLIIFHWDADGITSTSLLKNFLELDPYLYVPRIGFYLIDLDEVSMFKGFDNIFIVDFGVETPILERLGDRFGCEVFVFDHHHRRHSKKIKIFNYLVDGRPYPSESVMVTELLHLEPNLLTVLGYVGDLFDRALNDRYSYILKHVESRYGYEYSSIKYMVDLIQSNYVFQDRDEIIRSVDYLIDSLEDPNIIFENDLWKARYNEMMDTIDRLRDMEPIKMGRVLFFEVKESLYITSYIGRDLAKKYRGYYVLVGFPNLSDGYSQIYLRIDGEPDISFRDLIAELNNLGLYAGGKERVLGVFMEKDRYREVINHILKKLGVGDGMW